MYLLKKKRQQKHNGLTEIIITYVQNVHQIVVVIIIIITWNTKTKVSAYLSMASTITCCCTAHHALMKCSASNHSHLEAYYDCTKNLANLYLKKLHMFNFQNLAILVFKI